MELRLRERCSLALQLLVLCALGSTASALHAQASPTATRKISLSAFGAISGVLTDMNDGRNVSITVGGDLNLSHFYGFYPSIEVRGTVPVDKGNVISLTNFAGGVKLARHFGRFQPYGDFLIGSGRIDYGAGMLSPDRRFFYRQSTSTVLSPGAGIDYRITNHISLKADGQFQHYDSPVAVSGSISAKSISLGAVYQF